MCRYVLLRYCLVIFFASTVSVNIYARENPFEPAIKSKEDSFKSNRATDYFKEFTFSLPTTARILKEITITYQNIDGAIQSQTIPIDKSIDWHFPILLSQKKAIITEYTHKFNIEPFSFFADGNKFYLYTKTNMTRSFILPSPHRIVIDVERSELESNGAVDMNVKYFSKVSINTHREFYRITITLDGQYKHDIKQQEGLLIIEVE